MKKWQRTSLSAGLQGKRKVWRTYRFGALTQQLHDLPQDQTRKKNKCETRVCWSSSLGAARGVPQKKRTKSDGMCLAVAYVFFLHT